MNSGGSKDDTDSNQPKKDGLIGELIGEDFINFNPRRDIYNVTFTFPKEAKEDISHYIKRNGKEPLARKIVEEVKQCRNADHK